MRITFRILVQCIIVGPFFGVVTMTYVFHIVESLIR